MKKLLIITSLFLCMASLQAQKSPLLKKVYQFIIQPENVDTISIYQPSRACFSLGVFTTAQKAGFDVNLHFKADMGFEKPVSGLSQYSLSENICDKLGFEIAYGNVSLSYSFELGSKSAFKKNAFEFNIQGREWGVGVEYFKITNPFITSLTLGEEGDEYYYHDEIIAEGGTYLRSLYIDGYYVFNNKRFAYPAAYKIGMVQRHTAGSWLVTARYMQGEFVNNPHVSGSTYALMDGYSTLQASVGGGYSANFVLWHKDPKGPRDQGLRNITLNLTAMPVITFANYLKTIYHISELSEETHVSKIWCYPMPNFIGNAAASITLGRFYFTAQFNYNWFYFRSDVALNSNQIDFPDYVDDLKVKGSFHDWLLKGMVVYRF